MKMLTATKSLSLSGGHIVSEQLLMPSYSPNAVTATVGQHFPWEEDVNEINTPDIDPSFFDSDPFKMKLKTGIDPMTPSLADLPSATVISNVTDDPFFATNPNSLITIAEDTDSQTTHNYEDMNLSQLLSQTNVDINGLIQANMLDSAQYVQVTADDEPVLHYMQPKTSISAGIDAIALSVITTNAQIMDTSSAAMTTTAAATVHLATSPAHHHHHHSQSPSPSPLQSYTTQPLTTINYSHLSPVPSPALSYTSSAVNSPASTLMSMDSTTTTSSSTITTIDGMLVDSIDQKPDLSEFLLPAEAMPTVINDHLYTRPTASTSSSSTSSGTKRRRKSSTGDSGDKWTTIAPSMRKKAANNTNSNNGVKKSRVTKRDKQKQMDEQILHYVEDNDRCRKQIEQMEREIEWCKNFLFKKVVSSARS